MEKETLVRTITEAANIYYNSGSAIMPDETYDALVEELRAIDPDHPLLNKVGARPLGQVLRHNIPAGSQAKLDDKNAYDK